LANVTVKFFATVREAVGTRSVQIEAEDIREVLDLLQSQYGRSFKDTVIDEETGNLKRFFSCMVNGKRIELLESYETKLKDGDAVAIFPPVGGG
jgi:molybdopterin synthase sulfur carrier subunit